MPDSPQMQQSEKQAKLLTVALELFRRSLTDSVSFMLANRDRKIDAAPPWARQSIQPPTLPDFSPSIPMAPTTPKIPLAEQKPATEPNVYGMAAPTPPAAKPDLPPIPLAGAKPDLPPIPLAGAKPDVFSIRQDANTTSFGGGRPIEPKTSNVSAFDRPQSVVIVGPRPLPVKLDGALNGPAVTPRSERADMATGGSIGKALARQFVAVVGPLYAMSTLLNQTNSGFGVFQKSIQVFAATLAPIVLPVFMTLAAGLLTISDIIWNKLYPALGDFYEWAIKFGLQSAEKKANDAKDAVDLASALKDFATTGTAPRAADLPRMADTFARNIDPTGVVAPFISNVGGLGDLSNWTARRFGFGDWQQGMAARSGSSSGSLLGPAAAGLTPAATPARSMSDALRANMDDAIESLKRSMGVKATYAGLEDVGRQAQLAALNNDPIEMRAAQRIIETIQIFMAAFDRAVGRPTPQPNTFNAGGLASSFALAASTFSRTP